MNNRDPRTLEYGRTHDLRHAVRVKFKKLDPKAVIPKYSNFGDAGIDLTCTGLELMEKTPSNHKVTVVKTGLAMEIPPGYVGFLFPRSSISKKDWRLSNCVGVIDSGYRGEIKAKFDVLGGSRPQREGVYTKGDRCLQLIVMPVPFMEVEEVTELSNSKRGAGGFGSSGK